MTRLIDDQGVCRTAPAAVCSPEGLAGRPPGGAGQIRRAGGRERAPHLQHPGVAALQGAGRKQEVRIIIMSCHVCICVSLSYSHTLILANYDSL